jgi:hypothetical protein
LVSILCMKSVPSWFAYSGSEVCNHSWRYLDHRCDVSLRCASASRLACSGSKVCHHDWHALDQRCASASRLACSGSKVYHHGRNAMDQKCTIMDGMLWIRGVPSWLACSGSEGCILVDMLWFRGMPSWFLWIRVVPA